MQEYISPPWMTEPKARAKRFRQGATKRLAEDAYMFSEASKWYWLHWKISTKRAIQLRLLSLAGLAGLQQQTRTVACDAPLLSDTAKTPKRRGERRAAKGKKTDSTFPARPFDLQVMRHFIYEK